MSGPFVGEVQIDVAGSTAVVRAPFAAKDAIKEVTGRRWDADRKVWVIPADGVPLLAAHLTALGYAVTTNRQPGAPHLRVKPGDGWAMTLFGAVGPTRSAAIYKALSRVLHPDMPTGSTELMQQLNAARDRQATR